MRISTIAIVGPEDITYDKNTRLLEHLSIYLGYFNKVTTSNLLITDKDAYERICSSRRKSLGSTIPGKKIIIFSRTQMIEYANKNIIQATSVDDALDIAREMNSSEIIIIGGKSTYQVFSHLITRLYLIHPFGNFYDCQSIANFKQEDWKIIHRWHQSVRRSNPCDFSFKVLDRKKQNVENRNKTLTELKL